MTGWLHFAVLLVALFSLTTQIACSRSYNGFDVSDALILATQIHLGGPPRDGIPALAEPRFVAAARADFLQPGDAVLGLALNGVAKAYPFAELSRTSGEIQDSLNGTPLTIRFDVKAQSAMVFDRTGRQLPAVTAFWFAWYAFHPQTGVYRASRR